MNKVLIPTKLSDVAANTLKTAIVHNGLVFYPRIHEYFRLHGKRNEEGSQRAIQYFIHTINLT